MGKDRKGWCVMGPGAGGRTGRGVVGPGSELQDESILEMFLNNVNILNTLLNRTAGPARLLVGGPWGWSLGGSRARLLLELRAAGSGRPSVAGPGLGERPGLVDWVGAPHCGPSCARDGVGS